jgi:ribosome-binding factor A
MAKYRRGRINEEMYKETAQILRTVKDPRVSDAFVSVTAVDVTPDLKYAKVYYSAMMGDKKQVQKGLEAAAGYIRTQLAKNLNLRVTPELTFLEDTSIAYGAKIEKIISGFTYSEDLESPDVENDDE